MTQPFAAGQMPAAQPAPIPPVPKKSGVWTSKPLIGVYAGVAGLLIGAAMFSGGDPAATATPAPTATVTTTVTAPPSVVEGGSAPSEEPADDPTQPEAYKPSKSDWKVDTKITGKECFGSAGCNVEVTISPKFVGSTPPPDSGTVEVTYQLTGAEDPLVNTFTVEGGQISYTKTEDVSTRSSKSKIGSKITDVTYSQ